MKKDYDIIVAGSGFAGSLMAMIARRLGRTVALIERGRHPRFAIGESSTPLANLLLEELARRYDLPRLLPLTKWGTWQRERPEIGCGLKRGFTFFHHRLDEPFALDGERRRQFLVAASPHDGIADTHWFREDLDAFLMEEAKSVGVEFLDQLTVDSVELAAEPVELHGSRAGEEVRLRGHLVIDASGPRGMLQQALRLQERSFAGVPQMEALYTHFRDVKQSALSIVDGERPPFPPDAAAVHHVFPGGWIWVLRFNNGIVSAGASVERKLATELKLEEGERGWHRLLQRLPSVRDQFVDAKICRPFVHQSRVQFRASEIFGTNWVMLPSAAGFVDPLLSTGFPLTLLGVDRLARMLEQTKPNQDTESHLREYARSTNNELDATADLIGTMLRYLDDPEVFNSLSLLYFAAASYSEAARRLNRTELAPGFLLCKRKGFFEPMQKLLSEARTDRSVARRQMLLEQIPHLIAPINVAGLANPALRNWYPARAEDLLEAAAKLDSSPAAIREMLAACGMSLAEV